MEKLTKIVATIGPASDSEEKIASLIDLGVNIFRFNFKHNLLEWHEQRIQRVQKVAQEKKALVGLLLDLQGPEIRLKTGTESVPLTKGLPLRLNNTDNPKLSADRYCFAITHPSIIPYLAEGQEVLADDGAFIFKIHKDKENTYLVPQVDGELFDNKTLNIPSADFPLPVITERDLAGIKLAKKYELDYLALSFVRSSQDVNTLKSVMQKEKAYSKVIAKIETGKAINNLDEIVSAADGVMVARGDLGVELPIEQVPHYQKQMIRLCLEKGKTVITATQMLQSMIKSPYPTRAEISDIANAVFDHTDAIMLSGETANGSFPQQAVTMMAKTAKYNESLEPENYDIRTDYNFSLEDQEETICNAAYDLYLRSLESSPIKAVLVFTETGRTARLLSRYHLKCPLFAFCPNKVVASSLTLNYGVLPIVSTNVYKTGIEINSEHLQMATKYLLEQKYLSKTDKILVLHGDFWNISGGISTIKLIKI